MNELVDLVLSWRGDAVKFVRHMFDVEPTGQQARILAAACEPGAHVAVKSGHGTGKSTVLSWLILWALVCYEDVKIPCTAPTAHQLHDILWPEVEKWARRMLEPWKSSVKITTETIGMEGLPGFAVARTGRKENPEALQGFHAETILFLVDEASGIDDKVFEVAKGALSTPSARVVMTSNPTRSTGYFHQAFHAAREHWRTLTLSCLDSPLVAREYVEEMREEYGEDSDIYRIRVLGEFPGGGDLQFIRTADAEAALARRHDPGIYNRAPRVLGVDVAAYGGDRSVIVERQGLYARVVWQVQGRTPGYELATLVGEISRLWQINKYQAVFIDMAGVGFGAVSDLRTLGYSPFGVQFGGAAADAKQYKNKRAECWGLMRGWIAEGGMIDGGPDRKYAERLRDDLTGPDYQYDMQGRLQLERKEEMRKRGLASPDYADALALTFALPIAPGAKRIEMPKAGRM